MNKAIRMAQGKVLYFLNADDELCDSDVIADVAREFAAHPDIEFLFGNVVYRMPGQESFHRQGCINRVTLPFENLCHQSVFARRVLFSRVGSFDLRWPMSADYDWFLRVFASGAKVKHIDRYIAFLLQAVRMIAIQRVWRTRGALCACSTCRLVRSPSGYGLAVLPTSRPSSCVEGIGSGSRSKDSHAD